MSKDPRNFQRKLPGWRAAALFAVIALAFAAVLARDAEVQGWLSQRLRSQGAIRMIQERPLPAQRGSILADNGQALAVNVPAVTVWADPRIFSREKAEWPRVAQVLGLTPAELAERVKAGGADFAYLERQVLPQLGREISALHVPGLYVQKTSRSYYPLGPVTTALIGLVHLDHHGAAGLERGYDSWLSVQPGREKVLVDGKG